MDRHRPAKDETPPPLLLMPAGRGLTLDHTPEGNILMPVIQAEPSLVGEDDVDFEGEADSFLGQSPPQSSTSQATPFSYFQQAAPPQGQSTDPFAAVGQEQHQQATDVFAGQSPFTTGQQTSQAFQSTPLKAPGVEPSTATMSAPPIGVARPTGLVQTPTGPPAEIRPPDSGSQTNFHRQGRPRYIPPPDSYEQTPSSQASPPGPPQIGQQYPSASAYQTSPPLGYSQVGPHTGYNPGGQPTGYNPVEPPPSSVQPPFGLPPPSSGSNQANPGLGPPPVASIAPQSHVPQAYNANVASYEPVSHHWFYCKRMELRLVWKPFSMVDSKTLEQAFKQPQSNTDDVSVPTDGGRYDVSLTERQRSSVYWTETASEVRRCSWFYKNENDSRFVPYEESFAELLEGEFRNAVTNNVWHKRVEFPGGECIVIHNPKVIVNFKSTSQMDEYGNMPEEVRPRVVKRGFEDIEAIPAGEPGQIDHLVLFVHGIGPICDLRFRGIVECVDDFRAVSLSLMSTHFSQHGGRVGRVEYLPVYWYDALHGEATGVDRKLRNITLKSISKLRRFTNDVLLDILFYTAPKYCQTIADTVTCEVNRLYRLFCSRNPNFQGQTSLAGHSLGLCATVAKPKRDPSMSEEVAATPTPPPSRERTPAELSLSEKDSITTTPDSTFDQDLTLEGVLDKLCLNDYLDVFNKEQIDLDTLSMCEESDIKELGLPMGPRKKLQTYIKDRRNRQAVRRQEDDRSAQLLAEQKASEQALMEQLERVQEAADPSSLTSVDYVLGLAGTGQPVIQYSQLDFSPTNFFALGSPISMFLTVRGIDKIGDDFKLPTCQGFFHIFHPFDPVAYRIEPLINQHFSNVKPVQMPHHKGRKRLHLELREGLTRVGADLKQKIIESFKSTWNSLNSFAKAHQSTPEAVVGEQVDNVLKEMTSQEDHIDETSVVSEDDIQVGSLNAGRRIDYVLQEKPIESFNDYLFALGSHACYWESEDTALMLLKEIYTPLGFVPHMPGSDITKKPPISMSRTSHGENAIPQGAPMLAGQLPSSLGQGQIPTSQQNTATNIGPPPLTGFVKR